MDTEKFTQERNEALLSMDREKIITYCKNHGVEMPENEEIFWIGIHEAIKELKDIPDPVKQQSVDWLNSQGYKSFK